MCPGRSCRGRVYPRVCGGTECAGHGERCIRGLSPRVRGNPHGLPAPGAFVGSIPACAGEPAGDTSRLRCWPVYPRVCGGTPACAGEPGLRPNLQMDIAGNPRVCGGTIPGVGIGCSVIGEPPRVRGNHVVTAHQILRLRGTPACAGEPDYFSVVDDLPGGNPRVCGGTAFPGISRQTLQGEPPRVRGNQFDLQTRPPFVRGTPACAGEPVTRPAWCWSMRGNPRVCGGTACREVPGLFGEGEPPRVRGNLPDR